MINVSVVLPALNERGNIGQLIDELLVFKGMDLEIVVVDDNSNDGTAELVKQKYGNNTHVKLIERRKDLGLARAILAGIKHARGEVIVGMDADGNHDPKILPLMVKKLNQADMVVASRFVKGGGMDNKLRQGLTWIFNLGLRWWWQMPSTDNMSGYYAIRKSLLNQWPMARIYQGYGEYHLRLMWLIKISGKKLVEVPVYYRERSYGKSKSRLGKLVWAYWQVCRQLAKVRKMEDLAVQ